MNYRMDQILCQIFKTISGREKLADNSQIRIYVNKIENRITFKIKRGHFLKYLTLEAIKLLGRTKSKIKKMKMVKMCLIRNHRNSNSSS